MYDLMLKRHNKDQNRWRILVIAVTFIFLCICISLIIIDNLDGIFFTDTDEGCSADASLASTTAIVSKSRALQSRLGARNTQDCKTQITSSECTIMCSAINIKTVIAQVDSVNCGSNAVHLILENVDFTNERMQEGWLNGFRWDIKTLEILKSTVSSVEERAFAGSPFINLERLVLDSNSISYIKKDTFKDSKLSIFEFRFTELTRVNFEFGALQHLSSTLSALQLMNCILHPQTMVNLTGTGLGLMLLTVDLRLNSIKYLMNKSFIDVSMAAQLYLSNNNIEYIEQQAFAGLGNAVATLQIDNNKLHTLPDGIFNEFLSSSPRFGNINISRNPWICDCKLQWLKDFYEAKKSIYFGDGSVEFKCQTAEGEKQYYEVDFCPSKTTSLVSTTTEITTITNTRTMNPVSTGSTSSIITSTNQPTIPPVTINTTNIITSSTLSPDDNNYVYLFCDDCSKKQPFRSRNNRLYSHTILIRNGSITYDFYELEDTPYYDINLKNSVRTDYMIWFNTVDQNDIGCQYNIQEIVSLETLKYEQTYIVCLLKQNETTVSPFDCTSLTVPSEWSRRPWIFNKDKILITILYILTLLIVIIVTATVMYCTIRRHPKLVKATKTDVDGNDLHFDKEQYLTPAQSMYSSSDGYLTPKYYERIMTRRRLSRKLSTISERDFEGAFNVVYDVSESHLYEPPPLPPNHPSKWRKLECEEEFCSPYQLGRSKSFKTERRVSLSPIHDNSRSNSFPDESNNYNAFCINKLK